MNPSRLIKTPHQIIPQSVPTKWACTQGKFSRANFHVEMLNVDGGLSEPFSISAGFCRE
jgi:hypothetical protein